jgi:hypothetical protein
MCSQATLGPCGPAEDRWNGRDRPKEGTHAALHVWQRGFMPAAAPAPLQGKGAPRKHNALGLHRDMQGFEDARPTARSDKLSPMPAGPSKAPEKRHKCAYHCLRAYPATCTLQ